MAYARFSDLVTRFGETEITRLAAPDGQLDGEADRTRVQLALEDASALIDSYVRGRYQVPLNPVPPEVVSACCKLARYELAQGEGRTPSEQMKDGRTETIRWLERLSSGQVDLPGLDIQMAASSFARTKDRPALHGPAETGPWPWPL